MSPALSQPTDPALEPIATAAAAAVAIVATDSDQRVEQIEERIAKLEPLLESREQDEKFSAVFSEYVNSLKDEQLFLNKARWAFGIAAFLTIVLILTIIALAIFSPESPLLSLKTPPASVAIFIVGMFSAAALLLNGVLKGVLRSASERHGDGFLPPQIEQALKLHDRLNGKG